MTFPPVTCRGCGSHLFTVTITGDPSVTCYGCGRELGGPVLLSLMAGNPPPHRAHPTRVPGGR